MLRDWMIIIGVIVLCLIIALVAHYFGWSDEYFDDDKGFPHSRRDNKRT